MGRRLGPAASSDTPPRRRGASKTPSLQPSKRTAPHLYFPHDGLLTGVQQKERGAGVCKRRQLARIETAPSAQHQKPRSCRRHFPRPSCQPAARSADLLLPSRAARLDRGRGLLIANVDDAPRDAISERELQDLRKTAGSHARSYFGRSTARARPQPCRTCS